MTDSQAGLQMMKVLRHPNSTFSSPQPIHHKGKWRQAVLHRESLPEGHSTWARLVHRILEVCIKYRNEGDKKRNNFSSRLHSDLEFPVFSMQKHQCT